MIRVGGREQLELKCVHLKLPLHADRERYELTPHRMIYCIYGTPHTLKNN